MRDRAGCGRNRRSSERALHGLSLPDGAALCVLVSFLMWSIAGEAVRTGGLGPDVLDDYAFARDLGSRVVASGHYADPRESHGASVVFAYPPPFALLQVLASRAGPIAGPLAYMLMLAISGAAVAWSCLRLLGASHTRLRFVAMLIAVAACRVFVQSDLHHLNSNTLTVALALGALVAFGPTPDPAGRNAIGGFLLACSLGIKPWAAGMIPLLAVLGRWRALRWSLAWGAIFFVVAPMLVLGPRGALDLTHSWFELLALTADPESVKSISVDNVSLPAAAAALGIDGRIARPVIRVIQFAWTVGLCGLVLTAIRGVRAGVDLDGRRWLIVGATLLVVPVPLTAIFQPHHAVVAVPLAIVVAFDGLALGISRPAGWLRLGVLGLVFAVSTYAASGPARGPFVLASLAWLVGAAWWPIGRKAS